LCSGLQSAIASDAGSKRKAAAANIDTDFMFFSTSGVP
jgi:hypothetical protein